MQSNEADTSRGSFPPPAAGAPTTRLPGWWGLHLWQIQPLRDVLVLAAIFGVVWLGYRLSLVTVPILLALLLAYLFEPLVRWATRWRPLTRPVAAASIILGALLVLLVPAGVGIAVGGVQTATYAQELSRKVGALASSIDKPDDAELASRVNGQGPAWTRLREKLLSLRTQHDRVKAMNAGQPVDESKAPPDRVAAAAYDAGQWAIAWVRDHADQLSGTALATGSGVLGVVTGVAGSVGAAVFGAFLTAFFFFFICSGWGRVIEFWQSIIPHARRAPVIGLVQKMDDVIAGFVRGRLTICAILVVHYSLGYWLIGLPAPLIVGPIIGILAILPYISSVGIPLAIALLLLSPPDDSVRGAIWWAFVGPLIVHGLAQVLDDYILTPRIQGDRTGMNTPTILFASLAGGILMGFYGLLIAIPVAACLKILLKEVVWPQIAAWAAGRAVDPLPVAR